MGKYQSKKKIEEIAEVFGEITVAQHEGNKYQFEELTLEELREVFPAAGIVEEEVVEIKAVMEMVINDDYCHERGMNYVQQIKLLKKYSSIVTDMMQMRYFEILNRVQNIQIKCAKSIDIEGLKDFQKVQSIEKLQKVINGEDRPAAPMVFNFNMTGKEEITEKIEAIREALSRYPGVTKKLLTGAAFSGGVEVVDVSFDDDGIQENNG